MKTRLLQETSCVHGYFQDCTFLVDSGEPCPGGTSREVTVDAPEVVELAAGAAFEAEYDITWKQAKEAYTDEEGFAQEIFEGDHRYYYAAGRAVLAALGGGW